MGTFAYAPDIRVLINSTTNGIIDISHDLSNWNLIRRSNAVSTFNFTLQNANRKYDGMFRPGDQITVELKRLVWSRVFSGSLNVTPIFSSFPRALPMSASCTLKKLQFWPWDPSTTAANALLQSWHAGNTQSSIIGDAGLSGLMRNALVKVTDWPVKGIHIGEVPNTWFKWAEDVEKRIDLVSNMAAIIGSGSVINGQVTVGSIKLQAGPYGFSSSGGQNIFTQEQVDNAMSIYAAVLGYAGLTSKEDQDLAAVLCLMCAMQESSLINSANATDHDSVGLFQQRATWGTVAERTNPIYATKGFLGLNGAGKPLGVFNKVPNWRTYGNLNDIIAIVQVPAPQYKYEYGRWESSARNMITRARAVFDSMTTSTGDYNAQTGIPTGQGGYKASGTQFGNAAMQLAKAHPEIPYSQQRPSHFTDAVPPFIDCSGLVEWAYYHVTGEPLKASDSGSQYALCSAANLTITLDQAKHIQGALLFRTDNGRPGDGHVEISLGNGYKANGGGAGVNGGALTIDPFDQTDCTLAGLLPGIDYSGSIADDNTLAIMKAKYPQINWTKTSVPIGDPSITVAGSTAANAPFQQLINALSVNPAVGGDIFGGSRQYIHTQKFLPWIQNLCNSSMRAFCSAPNGDFMAWFPDYFGVFKQAAIMNIEPIELMDFTLDWSDQQIVTHEFVTGTRISLVDQGSGSVIDATPDWAGTTALLSTHGIATMDFPEIFRAVWNKKADGKFIQDYLARFGVRPNVDQMPNIQNGPQEFFMALWNFMFYWASQFNAIVPMTFMPELYPGMLLRIPKLNFQAYVLEVEHSGSYGNGGKFVTQAKVIAPARISSKGAPFGPFTELLPAMDTDSVGAGGGA